MHFFSAYATPDGTVRRLVFQSDVSAKAYIVVKHITVSDTWHVKVWLQPFLGPEQNHWSTNVSYTPSPTELEDALLAIQVARDVLDRETITGKRLFLRIPWHNPKPKN